MIEYIRGTVAELTPTTVTIDTQSGLGYLLNITLSTYSALEGAEQAKLLVHEVIREDAWLLFGFSTEQERSIFRALIGVSGVGANTARMILSTVPAPELEVVISNGNVGPLKAVKGVGVKTAQRIIVDLKDKIKPLDDTLVIQPQISSDTFDEALAALVMLGFPRPQSQKALKKLFDADNALTVEGAIKKALTMM
ncbi:MAG: Holliday junction branch migration protein RuvA [Bacteroidales bacterium]|nr:Holliday junction branch migration protein RuvA [Bacteroidales bacterium]MDE6801621.1 Holliday junction branch migration protein RuvA [Muribaculaceae bacterium]MDE6831217.1 Holliday junction branch migration protein RuvA [Muribaculaceae bacterium]